MKLFGTDGLRGIYGSELNPIMAFNLGRALGLFAKNGTKKKKIAIGRDTRVSCDVLLHAFVSGVISQGANVVLLGILPTPAISFVVKQFKYDFGVMITASHNSAEYNGIKIFGSDGTKLTQTNEQMLSEIYFNINKKPFDKYKSLGKITSKRAVSEGYLNSLISLTKDKKFPYSVCFDCANGATAGIVQKLFIDKFKQLFFINTSTNGLLVNKACGATDLENLRQFVLQNKLDFGFAFDGDGDRIMMIDSCGNIVDGDDILYILADYFSSKNQLKQNTVIGTVLTNKGLENAFKSRKINLYRTDVGDKYIIEHMNTYDFNLGGEPAGHIIIRDYNPTGDAILTSVFLLFCFLESGKDILKSFKKYPQISVNIQVEKSQKESILKNEKLLEAIDIYNKMWGSSGRLIMRASGTESVIRLMAEGSDKEVIKKAVNELENMIKSMI